DPQDATVAGGDSAQIDGLSGEQAHLADELAGPIRDYRGLVLLTMVLDDLDRPFQYNDHVVGLVSVREQDVSVPNAGFSAVASQSCELGFSEQGSKIRVLGSGDDPGWLGADQI